MTAAGAGPDVDAFLSYASDDEPLAEQLACQLRDAGVVVWFAKWELPPGAHLLDRINEALARARKVVAVWSPAYFRGERAWTRAESFARLASDVLARDRPLIPVLIETCEVDALFRGLRAVDYRRVEDRPMRFLEILRGLDLRRDLLAPAPAVSAAPGVGLARARTGLADPHARLVADVRKVYELCGHNISDDQTGREGAPDLRIHKQHLGIVSEAAVFCRDRVVADDDVGALVEAQIALKNESAHPQGIVISSQGFSVGARRRLSAAGLAALSYADILHDLIPLDGYVASFVRDYEKRVEERWGGDPERFIRPRVRLNETIEERAAIEFLAEWLAEPRRRMLLLLGDLGTGKSTLVRFFAYQLACAYLDDPLRNPAPMLIRLIDVRQDISFDSVVITHLAKMGIANPAFSWFEYLLRQQRIVLVFDGFDEMANEVQWKTTTANFAQLKRAATEFHGKTLLTCRTHYFRDRDEQARTIGNRVRLEPANHGELPVPSVDQGVESVTLETFTDDQIRQFLSRARPQTWEADWQMIESSPHLGDLARRPLLLELIAGFIDRIRNNTFTIASLYDECVRTWVLREQDQNLRTKLDARDRLRISAELACELWRTGRDSADFHQLLDFLAGNRTIRIEDNAHREAIARELQAATFLTRNASDQFGFMHSSFKNYFIAQALLAGVDNGELTTLLQYPRIDPDVAYFLACNPGRALLMELVTALLRESTSPPVAVNCVQLAYWITRHELRMSERITDLDEFRAKLATRIPPGSRLANIDLSKIVLEGAHLIDVDLAGANLTRANLMRTHLVRCRLAGAVLEHANAECMVAEHLEATEVNLRGAIFSNTRMISCDFTGAVFDVDQFAHAQVDDFTIGLRRRDPAQLRAARPQVQTAATGAINGVAFHQRRGWLAAAGDDGVIRIHDSEHRVLMALERQGRPFLAVAFHPTSDVVAAADRRGVSYWEVSTGAFVRALDGAGDPVSCLALDPSGAGVAIGYASGAGSIWLQSGEREQLLRVDPRAVHAVAVDAAGALVAFAGDERVVRIWSRVDQRFVRELSGHDGLVRALAFDGGSRLAVGGDDKIVRIWNVANGQLLREMPGHRGRIRALSFDPTGHWLVSGSSDGSAIVWDVGTGAPHRRMTHEAAVCSVAVDAAGERVAVGGATGGLSVFTLPHGRLKRSSSGNRRTVWSVAVNGAPGSLAATQDGAVWLWPLEQASPSCLLFQPETQVSAVAFSREHLFTRGDDGVRIWRADGTLERFIELRRGIQSAIATDEEGAFLASGTGTEGAMLWNLRTGEAHRVGGDGFAVRVVAIDRGGRRLATADHGNRLALWRLPRAKPDRVLFANDAIAAAAFSPDGAVVAAGLEDGSARLWSVTTGDVLLTLVHHDHPITCVQFDDRGERLVTSSNDGRVAVWNAASGALLQKLDNNRGAIYGATFGPSGRHVLLGGAAGRVQIWDLDASEPSLTMQFFDAGEWLAFTGQGAFAGSPGGLSQLHFTEPEKLESLAAHEVRDVREDLAAVRLALMALASAQTSEPPRSAVPRPAPDSAASTEAPRV